MYILGLNYSIHDASACLVRDGVLIAAAEEERFLREKHAWNRPPWYSALYCLHRGGISLEDVDYVATSFVDIGTTEPVAMASGNDTSAVREMLPASLFPAKRVPVLARVNHHLAHAASAFRCSEFDRAAILIVDGRGETVSTTIAVGENNAIRVLRTWDLSQSLGFFYEALSKHIGLSRWGDGGKTMGLAGWGTPRHDIPGIAPTDTGYAVEWPSGMPRSEADSKEVQSIISRSWSHRFEQAFGPANPHLLGWHPGTSRRLNKTTFSQKYRDVAASGQRKLEEIIERLARIACAESGLSDLVLAGGVALNCSANGRLISSGAVRNLFVQPAANDAGTSIGAALELWSHLGNRSASPMRTAALGPEFDADTIRRTLETTGVPFTPCDPAETAARLLAEGQIVGWFQGRMEIGPRALGQRSILANPSTPGIQEYLNQHVKHRETFRPFAISLRLDDCPEVFEKWIPCPHMLMGFPVKPAARERLLGAVHVDGTTRPQTVDRRDIPLYWSVLDRFKQLTGIPGVLNTSLNDETEPIVCSPTDALRLFFSSSLDALVVGEFLVTKPGKRPHILSRSGGDR
jgi:carbamoyltransferase